MIVAILLAAGASTRAGEDKALAELAGKPLLRWSADRLAAEARVDRLLVVHRQGASPAAFGEVLHGLAKPYALVAGGARRADSVRAGLRACQDAEAVLVHDAARPFLAAATLVRILDAYERHRAAAAALPVADTLRRAQDEWAGETIEREDVWAMQTPQVFSRAALARAYARAEAPTDCAAAAVAAGVKVRLVRGDPLNFKVTTAEDLALARLLVARGVVKP